MHPEWPLSRDLVLVGGGHTHALVLRKWGMNPLAGARVTLINPAPSSPYTGMLPGYVAGHYAREELDIDLVRLARFAGARIIFDKARGLDRQARRIHLEVRPPVQYDVVSLDIGVTAALLDVDGFEANAHSVKPLGFFADAWRSFLDNPRASTARTDSIVIGGGVAGVELALAMASRMSGAGFAQARVTLIESSSELLRGTNPAVRRKLTRALTHHQVSVLAGAHVSRVSPEAVELADGTRLAADFVVSAAGARPYPWLAETGLAHTGGFVDVGPDLSSPTDPDVFAAGDCAHLTHAPRPKAGVFAVREAPALFENLRARLTGSPMRHYNPQSDYLKLISMGGKTAIGNKHALTVSGPTVWTLKDRIDRTFMTRLNDLPPMRMAPAPSVRAIDEDAVNQAQMLCGGCGSKVGRASLSVGIANPDAATRPGTPTGLGDDAAVLGAGSQLQVISTDHLRAFVEDPYVLGQIAAIHALGDVWAKGAAPQSGLLSLIIPRMSERMQAATVTEVVSAVRKVLGEAGADLVGGHTSMGRDLTVGLTVTGLLDGPVIGHDGAQPGDAIILTKPLGTGVILAAEMRGLARGEVVATALTSMQRSLTVAAGLLSPVARAMTDVTGFGLAGHLMNILEASNVAARLTLANLPVLPGAEQLAELGIRSSLWKSNASLDTHVTRTPSPISDLLHDPQTAGGLLAVVPAGLAEDLVATFEARGEPVFLIGHIEAGLPHITVA